MSANAFCGQEGGVFWDLNLTWYGPKPDFTDCFKDTALLWIPIAIFWLLVPFDLVQLHRNRGYPSKNWVGKIQLISLISTTIIFTATIVINTVFWQLGKTVWFWWGFGSYALYAITLMALIILSCSQLRAGFTGSASIWLFLFSSMVCGFIQIASMWQEDVFSQQSKENQVSKGLFIAYYIMMTITLMAYSFSSVPVPSLIEDNDQEPFPEDFCSFPNYFAFGWVFPTLWKGYRTDLELKDLWGIHPMEKSQYLTPKFEKIFRSKFAPVVESKKFNGIKTTEGEDNEMEVEIKSNMKTPSMLKIFAKEFGGSACMAGFIELVNVVLVFVEPVVVGLLTSFATNLGTEPTWHGYFYATILACSLFARTFLEQCAWFRMVRLGRNVNSILIGCIYRKALRITSEARKSNTIGEIVNLMSVDADRFFDFALDMHTLWSAPLQFILGFYIAYRQVGVAVWAGVGYIVLLSIANALITRVYEVLQEEQMELKDERVKLLTEILNGIKVIKLYGWEPAFQRRIESIRNQELKCMRYSSWIGAFYEFSWHSTALVASFVVLATYAAISPDHSLKAEAVFVILTVFHILTFPLSVFPEILAHFVMVRVSLKRVVEFFSGQELEENQVERNQVSDLAIQIQNATLAWDSTSGPILHNLHLDAPRGKLVAIVGKVGAGKSSLLSALCGEMHKIDGTISVKGSIAYVPQQAWIQNMTIKDNILFGKAFNEYNYNRVIEACCLKPDFESLPAGDLTEIGERGINLSGGQKQRVSLARAVYKNGDVYLLDDPLSAVDVHVGKHIFQHVIGPTGMLKDKTRILVTHALTYLPDCDLVVVIADGTIQEAGTFQELVAKKEAFADFVQQYVTEAPEEELEQLQAPEFQALDQLGDAKASLQQRLSRQKTSEDSGPKSPLILDAVLNRLASVSSEHSEKSDKPTVNSGGESGKLIDEELMEVGQVTWNVYYTYAKSAGLGLFLYVLFVVVALVFEMLSNIWLQKWTDNAQNVRQNRTTEVITTETGLLYLGLCGVGQMTFTLMLGIAYAMFQVKAAKLIHDKLLHAVLRAPMAFFDTTPTGRIINRCGKDINVIDNDVPGQLDQYSHFAFTLIYSIVGLFIFVPIFGAVLLPAALVYIMIQRIYVTAARRVRRLEAVTESPIYSHFQETLHGVSSIRAFNEMQRFCETSNQIVDIKFSSQLARTLFNRWVSIYLDIVGNSLVTAIVFAVVYMVIHGQMTAGVAGLSLSSFALQFPGLLAWGVHVASLLEMELVSMERIVEYSNVKPEAPWSMPHASVSPSWPPQGRVLFHQYGTRYRDGLPLVLHDFTADVQPMEKIGVVGRTGAGKSSLTLALFRILEAAEGQILIDDVDISRLGLHELRWKLSIIPQDPVLFSGPLRINLDPFDQHTDDELWLALERSKLKEFISNLPEKFQHPIDEGGSNLSVGQRQLICLARALLRKSKILVLDEATASIDVETDAWIQATIREQFKHCTIITIAHRLNTILDSDKIMVLDSGRMVEYDSPANLASREDSIFGNMLKEVNRTQS